MKLAVITINYNNSYKLQQWIHWYEEYKNSVSLHIIVDNGSKPEELDLVKKGFPHSQIIELGFNGGCTAAYNAGIKYALSQPDITHIALVGSDIRLEKDTLTKCVELLEKDVKLGMVAPVLLNADSDIVADFGCGINDDLTMRPFGRGEKVQDLQVSYRYCDSVTGGMNVSKRSFYETVGLQDENIFMYSDEVDMGMRAKKVGVKLAVTREGKSWHQHIVPPIVIKRHPYSSFLIARNKVYLANKHFGRKKAKSVFNRFFFGGALHYIINVIKLNFNKAQGYRWQMIGAYKGIKGDMKPNKYSHL